MHCEYINFPIVNIVTYFKDMFSSQYEHVIPINTNWSYTCTLKEDILLFLLCHYLKALEYCQLPEGSYCNCGANVSRAISSNVCSNMAIYANI